MPSKYSRYLGTQLGIVGGGWTWDTPSSLEHLLFRAHRREYIRCWEEGAHKVLFLRWVPAFSTISDAMYR